MTISSALVGFATGDQRQIPSAEGPDPAILNLVPALQAGPWSTIDWEFGSVLRALIPDATDEPVSPGANPEKVDSSQTTEIETAAPQAINHLPKALPASLLLPFQWRSTQEVVVQPDLTPVAPTIAIPFTVEPPVKTLVPEVLVDPGTTKPQIPASAIPIRTSDIAPVFCPVAVPYESSAVLERENTIEAEVVDTPPVRTFDIVPALFTSPSLPVESHPSSEVPAKENTLEAEIVTTPTARPPAVIPLSPLPPAITFEPQPKETRRDAVPVKENLIVGDIAPAPRPIVLPASKPVKPESSTVEAAVVRTPDTVPAPDTSPVPPLPIRAESETVPVKQNPPEAPAVPIMAAPISDAKPSPVAFRPEELANTAIPAKEQPVMAPRTQLAPQIKTVQPPIEKTTARMKVEHREQPENPESLSPVVELSTLQVQAPQPAPKPIEAPETKSADPAPKLTVVPEDEPLPVPALTESKEPSTPPSIPNVVAPVAQAAAAPPPIASIKDQPDDEPKSTPPVGLIAVHESKPERSSIQDSPDPPAQPLNKTSVDLVQSPIAESKAKADQPSPSDTEIAFTGRLVPRRVVEEPVSRPDSIEPKLERLPGSPVREIPEAPVEHPIHPPAEIEHERPILRTEPGVIVSAVHRDTPAPVAADRPSEPLPAARTANTEIIQEPATRESSGPVREISMRFNDQAQDSAHLRVVEKGGEVLVSVRSGSEQLARTLSSDLGDLAHRLEQTGFQAELFRPSAPSSSSQPGHDRRDNPSTADQNPNQSWSRERRDSQQHPGQHAREWVEDLEESMGLSQ